MRSKIDLDELLELIELVSVLLVNSPNQAHQVTAKGRADYVTEVDLSVQSYLAQELTKRWSHVQFLGEEGKQTDVDWSLPVWILDPVDGTTNLIHGLKTSCISLALWDGKKLGLGIVCDPFRHETFFATRRHGALLNGKRISVSDRPTLAESLVLVGTSPYEKDRADFVFDRIKRTYLASEDIRRSGSAALDLCAVACGRCDAFWEYNLKPWDFAAGALILQEAGGKLSSPDGKPITPLGNADIVATNGHNHRELLKLLQRDEDNH